MNIPSSPPVAHARPSHLTAPRRRLSPARRGFSLVELVVAMTVLSVGLLALAGMSMHVLQTMTLAGSRSRALATAQARIESMRGARCSTLAGGSASVHGGGTERWTVESMTGARVPTAVVTDTVTFRTRAGLRRIGLSTVIPCEQ